MRSNAHIPPAPWRRGRPSLRAATGAALAARAPAVLLTLSLILLLAACGEASEDAPPQPFGPGTGGPAVGASTPFPIPDLAAGTLGTLDYDAAYFDDVTPEVPTTNDTRAGLLVSTTGGVSLQLSVIFGRPDTPCRFQAALFARDEAFIILGDGEDRTNDQGLDFHEVVLIKDVEHRRLDCASLNDTQGLGVLGVSLPVDALGTEQVHFVLNSIRP